MGEVWLATDRATGAQVAVKVLLPTALKRPELVERFAREGRMLKRIVSANVCSIIAEGREPDGTPFLVVEHLEGEELGRTLKRARHLSPADASPIITQIFQGLMAAHAVDVVHRDLKPANVMLVPAWGGGVVAKLLDFGVSKLLSGLEDTLTTDGATLGSTSYMAPEQMGHSAHVDHRVDVYAAATIAFRALTGRLPFSGDPVTVLTMKQTMDAPTLSEATSSRWPDSLERFFVQALARDPLRRIGSAQRALEAWTEGCVEAGATSYSPDVVVEFDDPDTEVDTVSIVAPTKRSPGD
jgi:serine/threonine-protein kinase